MRTFEPELGNAPTGKWLALEVAAGEAHTIPCGDLVLHEPDDCVCGPETVPVARADGSIGYVINHQALDGRA